MTSERGSGKLDQGPPGGARPVTSRELDSLPGRAAEARAGAEEWPGPREPRWRADQTQARSNWSSQSSDKSQREADGVMRVTGRPPRAF